MTDEERWIAVGKPEIICHDDGFDGGCYYIGPDCELRVCEICGLDEPETETHICPECGVPVWWVPKCPKCGKPATWTYGEIKSLEYKAITDNLRRQ